MGDAPIYTQADWDETQAAIGYAVRKIADLESSIRSIVAAVGGEVFVPEALIVDPPVTLITYEDEMRRGKMVKVRT